MAGITIFETVAAMRKAVAGWHAAGDKVALVPTMGALHEGHLALVERARAGSGCVVATIFVNPTQFAANEDLAKYPRTEVDDIEKLEGAGAEIVFAPPVDAMYPPGFVTTVSLEGPARAGLEDRFRPGHFDGVATVVAKLLLQSGADIAVFGEKDYQQLAVIRRLAADLDIPTRIVGLPTVRAPDGLALSSRNRYLNPEERARAPRLHAVLADLAAGIPGGADAAALLATARTSLTCDGFELDYLELRDAGTLAPIADTAGAAGRLLAAARLGRTRLIDNVPVAPAA